NPLSPVDLHAFDFEPGLAGYSGNLLVQQQSQTRKAGNEPRGDERDGEDHDEEELVQLLLGERQHAQKRADQRAGLRPRLADLGPRALRARLAAHAGLLAADRLRHQAAPSGSLPKWRSASSM